MTRVELGSRIGLGTAPLGSTEQGPLWWGPQDETTAIRTIHARHCDLPRRTGPTLALHGAP